MLKTLRTRTRKIMLLTLILVIPSFIFFYGWGSIKDRARTAATKNAFGKFQPAGSGWKDVTQDQMIFAQWVLRPQIQHQLALALMQQSGGSANYRQALQSASRLIGEVGLNNLAPNSDLYTECLNEWALNRYADQHRIRVSDQDVINELAQSMQGVTSREGQLQRLQEIGLTADDAPEYLAKSERLQRARLAFSSQARAPLFEMWNLYRQREEKIKLDYAYLELETYRAQVEATPDALATYYAAHKDDFQVGAQRQYRYALLRRDSLESGVKLTEDDYAKYYEDNKEKYRVPRKTQVREIFYPVDLSQATTPEARKDLTSATLSQAMAGKTMVDTGGDFAAIADRFSQDPANTAPDGKKLGGLLPDWFEEGVTSPDYGPNFSEAISKLEVGKVAGPVAVRGRKLTGFAIVKCEQVKDSYVPALAEVREKVEKDARDVQMDALFEQRIQEIKSKASGYTAIEGEKGLAKSLNLEAGLTSYVLTTVNEMSPVLGSLEDDDLKYLNDNLHKGELSDLIESHNEMGQQVAFVLQLADEKAAHIPELDAIKDKVADALKTSRGRELLKAAAQDALTVAGDTAALKAKAEAIKAKFDTTEPFTRVAPPGTLPGGDWIGFVRDSMVATTGTVGLSPTGPSLDNVQGYAVWRVAAMQTPSHEDFQKHLPELRGGLLASKEEVFVNEWLSDQRRQMKKEPPKGAQNE